MKARVRDVAARAGVSVGTVSNVLNGAPTVQPEVAARVLAAIDELGYVRNDAARQLRAGRSRTVALIVADVRNPFYTDMARGAEEEAKGHGLTVVLGNADEDPAREAEYLSLFEEQRVRGIVMASFRDAEPRVVPVRRRGTPIVLIEHSADVSLSTVSSDDIAGGRLAAEHLLERGRRRLALVGGPVTVRAVAERLAGAQSAVAAVAGASLELVGTSTMHTVLQGRQAAETLLRRPRASLPDGIIAINDLLGIGLVHELMVRGGLRVPEDIAVMGFDDIEFGASSLVPLTSVRQPSRALGATAVRILLEEAADPARAPQRVVFQPEIVARASTGG